MSQYIPRQEIHKRLFPQNTLVINYKVISFQIRSSHGHQPHVFVYRMAFLPNKDACIISPLWKILTSHKSSLVSQIFTSFLGPGPRPGAPEPSEDSPHGGPYASPRCPAAASSRQVYCLCLRVPRLKVSKAKPKGKNKPQLGVPRSWRGFPKGFPWRLACGFLLVTSRKPTERTQGTDTTPATSKGPCQTTLPRWEPQLKIIAMCKGDTPCRNSGRGVDHQIRHCPKLSGASSSPTNPRNPVATKPETGRIRHQPFVLESSHSCDEM